MRHAANARVPATNADRLLQRIVAAVDRQVTTRVPTRNLSSPALKCFRCRSFRPEGLSALLQVPNKPILNRQRLRQIGWTWTPSSADWHLSHFEVFIDRVRVRGRLRIHRQRRGIRPVFRMRTKQALNIDNPTELQEFSPRLTTRGTVRSERRWRGVWTFVLWTNRIDFASRLAEMSASWRAKRKNSSGRSVHVRPLSGPEECAGCGSDFACREPTEFSRPFCSRCLRCEVLILRAYQVFISSPMGRHSTSSPDRADGKPKTETRGCLDRRHLLPHTHIAETSPPTSCPCCHPLRRGRRRRLRFERAAVQSSWAGNEFLRIFSLHLRWKTSVKDVRFHFFLLYLKELLFQLSKLHWDGV